MPQNLVDTPPDWQDVIVVPAPGEPAAVANDPGKPHSLFHALAALAKRTRWLRGALEAQLNHHHDDRYSLLGHNHDDRYAPLNHHHDDRYYTKSEVDARRTTTTWANVIPGAPSSPDGVYVQFTAPSPGYYLLEGRAVWQCWGEMDWQRELWVGGERVYADTRHTNTSGGGLVFAGSWADQKIVYLQAGTYVVKYVIIVRIAWGGVSFVGDSMVKVTML